MDTSHETNEHLRDQMINIYDDRELAYWSYVLGTEREYIIHAVLKLGPCAKMVDDFLIMNRMKN